MVAGTYDTIGTRLLERYGDLVTDIEFSIAVRSEQDWETLRDLASVVQAADDTAARAALLAPPR